MPDVFQKCFEFTRARETMAAGLYPYFKPLQSATGPEVIVGGRKVIMIGSNNYLGLTQHPQVIEAAVRAVEKYGSGCTGSRFLNGTLDLHEELERELASFMKKDAVQVFSTGFQTNLGTIDCLVGKDDYAIIDRNDHASIIDGCRLSFGKTLKYRHNDMEDLERALRSVPDGSGKLVVVDGVFSMEGDLADLPNIVRLKKKYSARLMVDDAHGIGVFGKNGRGTCEHFGLEKDVDLVMGTFSKSFASLGGFIAGDGAVVHYLKHHSRALVFSASMPPSAVAVVVAALKVIQAEPELRERLWANATFIHRAFRELGLDIGNTESPVVPIIVGDDTQLLVFWKRLFEAGLFTNPILAPAVEKDRALIRTSYMAVHTMSHLERVVEIVERESRAMGLIGQPHAAASKSHA